MNRKTALQVTIIALATGALELLCRIGTIDRFTMIPPSDMVRALIALPGRVAWFWPDTLYTLRNLALAALFALAGGVLIGLVVHALPRLRRVMEPVFSSYYAVPTFILYPLLIVMLGIGPAPLIAMGVMFGIVAMISATLVALDRVPAVLLKVARISGMGRLRTALLVTLPAAAPHLLTGIKLTVAYCMIGIIAGEFILATAGIGRRLSLAYNDFDNETMYGVLLLIVAFAALLNSALNGLERRVHRRWNL